MKKILLSIALVAAARFAMADPPAARDDAANAPSASSARESASSASAASAPADLDNVEVVSADAATKSITLKVNGQEQTVPIRAPKAEAALKVVRPGDKVRVFYKEDEKDESGKLRAIDGFTITKPNSDQDENALKSVGKSDTRSDTKSDSGSRSDSNKSDRNRNQPQD
jgi:hypothetical protein